MASKDILAEQRLPTPLPPFSTGDAKVDAAIAKLAAWELSAYTPLDTPGGRDYDATVKVASKASAAKLLAILDDAACDTGATSSDEQRIKQLAPKQRKEYQKLHEAAGHASKARTGFLYWLMPEVLAAGKAGRDRLIAIATGSRYSSSARTVAAWTLTGLEAKADLLVAAKALDPRAWDGKGNLHRVYSSGVTCWHAGDAAGAYDALVELVAPVRKTSVATTARAEAVMSSLRGEGPFDPRWAVAIARRTDPKDLDPLVFIVLDNLPPDPAVIEPILAGLGDPATRTYWDETAVRVLSRVADKRVVPYLAAALEASWMNYESAFAGFARAGDPAAVPVIRAWLAENDDKDHERAKEGNAVIKKLEKLGPVPDAIAATKKAKAEPPPRTRPTLVYKKTKAFARPKLGPIATQEAAYATMFADAKIPKAAKILQRAVAMIPKRVDEKTLALGATKLGGHPDLSAKTPWPRVAGAPLTFLAQLSLADFAKHLPADSPLPKTGLLAFFVDNDAQGGGSYLENARVIVTEAGAKVVRHEVPDDFYDRIFQACSVECVPMVSLPSPNNAHVTKALSAKDLAIYEEEVFVPPDGVPQVLGYRAHGYDAEEPATAQMLLQLTGDDQSDMEFGDRDYLSFFIDAKRLAKGNFTKVWPKIGD